MSTTCAPRRDVPYRCASPRTSPRGSRKGPRPNPALSLPAAWWVDPTTCAPDRTAILRYASSATRRTGAPQGAHTISQGSAASTPQLTRILAGCHHPAEPFGTLTDLLRPLRVEQHRRRLLVLAGRDRAQCPLERQQPDDAQVEGHV